jgi:hypothetical protein
MPLSISIRFLTGRAHLHHWHAHHSDGKVDWPPSPWRLLRALVAAAGTGLTSLPEPLDENISDSNGPDDGLPVSRLASVLAMLAAPPKIWLPRTGGGHTRQFLPKEFKSTGSAVFDTFATVRKETPIVFEWPEVDVTTRDERFTALQILLRRVTYFGRAESWCDASAHTALPPELLAEVTHWCCMALEPGGKPSGREHVAYTLERKLTPCSGPNLPQEATSLLTRIKGADSNEDSVSIESETLFGSFPLNSFEGRLAIRRAPPKKKDGDAEASEEPTKSKTKSKPWLLVAIGPWTESERDALLKRPDLKGDPMKAAKKALTDVLKKRVNASDQNIAWSDELKRNSEVSEGGLLLLRCLLRSSGEDIKSGLERPIGSRWVQYTVPRAIYQLPASLPHRVARSQSDDPRITLMRFALNTATVNRPVLPSITDTLLVADKFRSASLAWHGELFRKPSDPRPRNLRGREDDDSIIQSGHDHACFWPTDEDGDGFIDHLSVFCRAGLQPDEVESLRRLLRLKQRGGRPDLLVTPVFEGTAEEFAPWQGTATTFVSSTPYYPDGHITHGTDRGSRLKLGQLVRRSIARLFPLKSDEPPTVHQIVACGNVPASFVNACPPANHRAFPKAVLFPANKPLPPGGDFLMSELSGNRTVRPLDFCCRRKGVVINTAGCFLQITFPKPQPRVPFALGHSCHFGLGLFVPGE